MSKVTFWKNKTDKQAIDEWEELLASIRSSTTIDLNETHEQKVKRIKKLEGDPEQWFEYYFPKYCFAKPAKFHILSTRRFLKAEKSYIRRAWARGLSKSTRRMMEILYKKFATGFRLNMLLLSKSEDNAVRLLAPYKANLEVNQRLINDYGVQQKAGSWTDGEFTTRDGSTFRAVGAGQSPRGAKNEELRINVALFDDVDDDEVCRNEDRLNERWLWVEKNVIPTVDISAPYFIIFDNNLIAEDSIAVRAGERADDDEIINIVDEDGNSSWPEKNDIADIEYMKSIISYESFEGEYMNNPMGEGKTFPDIKWGKCPPIKSLPFIISYADPATSNNDRPAAKSKAQNSSKAVVLVGYNDSTYYVYKCFVNNTSNSIFIDWLYAIRDYVANRTLLYSYIENNTLQEPFYDQVLLPLIFDRGKTKAPVLSITPDGRKKPEKWSRIEATLEPLNRMGLLVFNEDEKDDPHMKRIKTQFTKAKATSKLLDGPDAVQGAVIITQEKTMVEAASGIKIHKRPRNKKRF